MLLGIVSDTHDRYDLLGQAITALQQQGAQFFIHCGDVGAPRLLDHLAGVPSAIVWGNCDWDRSELARYGDSIGVKCHGALADLTLDGKRLAVTHGDDRALMQKILAEQNHDYLLHGHTHVRRDQRVGRTRIINPGALFRAAEKTVALLDMQTDALQFIQVA